MAQSPNQQQNPWIDYNNTIRNCSIANHETSKIDQYLSQFCRPTNWTLDEEPTFKEFKDTLKAMKNHKTTAVDPIPVEIYKYVTSKKLQSEIHLIILECWNTSIRPETFHDIIICSLFITGNKQMCKNQRGISLI